MFTLAGGVPAAPAGGQCGPAADAGRDRHGLRRGGAARRRSSGRWRRLAARAGGWRRGVTLSPAEAAQAGTGGQSGRGAADVRSSCSAIRISGYEALAEAFPELASAGSARSGSSWSGMRGTRRTSRGRRRTSRGCSGTRACVLPQALDYAAIGGLSNELRGKLALVRPETPRPGGADRGNDAGGADADPDAGAAGAGGARGVMSAPATVAAVQAVCDVSRETIERLEIHHALLEKWNPRINLVSKASVTHAWRGISPTRRSSGGCDRRGRGCGWTLASGAGFPGLVIAAIAAEQAPELVGAAWSRATSARRRSCARPPGRLDSSVVVHDERIEDLPPQGADVVSARALAPLDVLLGYAEKHRRPGGIGLFPKGETVHKEIADAASHWRFDHNIHPSLTEARGGDSGNRSDRSCLKPGPARTSSPSPTRRAASARPPRRSTSARRWRRCGHRVLVIDLDPQGNASTGLGIARCRPRLHLLRSAVQRRAGGAADVRDRGAEPADHPGDTGSQLGGRRYGVGRQAAAQDAGGSGDGPRGCPRAGLYPDRLPAVAQPADDQRAGGRRFGAGAAAVRVLRARGPVAADADGADGAGELESAAQDTRYCVDHV